MSREYVPPICLENETCKANHEYSTYSFGDETSKALIIAGSGDSQRSFYAFTSALKKSPVIKGWIEEPTSLPSSLVQDGALMF